MGEPVPSGGAEWGSHGGAYEGGRSAAFGFILFVWCDLLLPLNLIRLPYECLACGPAAASFQRTGGTISREI